MDLGDNEIDLAVLKISAGGVSGGKGFVLVNAAFDASVTNSTGCPCQGAFRITQDGGTEASIFHLIELNGRGINSGAATMVFRVNTATTQTFRLKGKVNAGTGTISSRGEMSAIYVPFGS